MKKFLMFVAVLLAACSSVPTGNADALAANAKVQITNACLVIQPTLLNLSASLPTDQNLATFTKANGEFCTAVNTLDYSSAMALVNTLIPQMVGMVGSLPVDDGTKTSIRIALGASSIALSQWLIVYGQPSSTVLK